MTPVEAARLLEVSPDAPLPQVEAQFKQLQTQLEDRIAKAPTPGLRSKYRDALAQLQTAHEVLTQASDTSTLPTSQRRASAPPPAASPSPSVVATASPATARSSPSHTKEFTVVALIAVLVLSGGGWFIWQSRQEAAERHRQEQIAQQQAEREAEQARAAAAAAREAEEAERLAAEAERERQAAAAAAEQERQERLLVQLRAELAELRVTWEAVERREREAERDLSEVRSEVRSLRDAAGPLRAELAARERAQESYYDWVREYLAVHPARVNRAKAEELVSARAPDDAEPVVRELRAQLAEVEREIENERRARLTLTGTVRIESSPAGLAWEVVDAWGRSWSGVTPADVTAAALGPVSVTIARPGWQSREMKALVRREEPARIEAAFSSGILELAVRGPSTYQVKINGQPAKVTGNQLVLPAEVPLSVEVSQKGYQPESRELTLRPDQTHRLEMTLVDLRPKPGERFTISGLDLTMVPIAPGAFMMGSPKSERGRVKDETQHQVTLTKPFWLASTEVTQGQWQALMGQNPSYYKSAGETAPVENVSWEDAMAYCRKLTERERAAGRLPEGYAYTLPTEAQWEYACRAGTTGDYAGNLDDMGWYEKNSSATPHPVAQKQVNAWGLYDLHGNVEEWCRDWYGEYPVGDATDPTGPPSGTFRVARGGSWFRPASVAVSSYRVGFRQDSVGGSLGFRLALTLTH